MKQFCNGFDKNGMTMYCDNISLYFRINMYVVDESGRRKRHVVGKVFVSSIFICMDKISKIVKNLATKSYLRTYFFLDGITFI